MRDPTGTTDLRAAFWREMRKRFLNLTTQLQRAIVGQDALGIGEKAQIVATPRADRVKAFEAWLQETTDHIVLGRNGEWMRPYLKEAIDRAVARADRLTGGTSFVERDRSHSDMMLALASAEVAGILAAFVQQATRSAAHALMVKKRASGLSAEIKRAAKKAAQRAKIVTEHLTIKSFSHATIEAFKAAGVEKVGTVPETVPFAPPDQGGQAAPGGLPPIALPAHSSEANRKPTETQEPEASLTSVAKGKLATTGLAGAAAALATVLPFVPLSKKRKEELEKRANARRAHREGLAAVTFANIETAGDDRVCDKCDAISHAGPYPIKQAAGMLPVHPRCRCVYTVAEMPRREAA